MFSSMVFAFERETDDFDNWSFYDCIWWGLMTLTTVGYHIQPQTFLGKLSCGLCALCGVFIITLPIPIVVSSFAICYRNKLWRNEITTRKRIALLRRRNTKEDIIFNLSTSSGMSGVRMKNEIIKEGSTASVYDELSKKENKVVMDLNFKNSAASEAIMSTLYPP